MFRKKLKSFLAAILAVCVFYPAFVNSRVMAQQAVESGNFKPARKGGKVSSISKRKKNSYPEKSWTKATSPEELGWSSEKLKLVREYSQSIGSAAVMIVVDGVIVDEWGETDKRFNVHSIRKSFLSALYGVAVKEGTIKLSSTLEELGIDDNEPSLTQAEKQARVIDLLQARSGIYHPALYETDAMKSRRPKRGSHPPNTFWYYNNWDFNALGTIYENATKSTIAKEFRKRFAVPLQMEDFRVEDVEYSKGADSIPPAYPFRMTARDMARFGLLFLREGKWRGKQIISKKWVRESTKSFSDAEARGGYGYLWWVAVDGKMYENVSFDKAYAAQGAGGHFILVVPNFNLVVVHRVNTDVPGWGVSGAQFGSLMKLIWDAGWGGKENSSVAKVGDDSLATVFGAPFKKPSERKVIAVASSVLDKYVGQYQFATNFILNITNEDGKLMAEGTGQPKEELFAESETGFFLKSVDARINFVKGEQGNITGLLLLRGGRSAQMQKTK